MNIYYTQSVYEAIDFSLSSTVPCVHLIKNTRYQVYFYRTEIYFKVSK